MRAPARPDVRGTVRVFLEELGEEAGEFVDRLLEVVDEGRPAAVATLLDGPSAGSRMALVDGDMIGGLRVTDLLDRNRGAATCVAR